VIRVLALSDFLTLAEFDEVFRTRLGWDGLGFSFSFHFHTHSQEFTSFLRRTEMQRTTLRDSRLGPTRHGSTPAEGSIFGNESSGFSSRA
jgi:hypothetical protein